MKRGCWVFARTRRERVAVLEPAHAHHARLEVGDPADLFSSLVEFDDVLTDRSDLFKEGILDSFGYVKFCRFLENTYGIRFSDAEITGNVMVSLRQIEDCVAAKVAG